MNMYTRTALFIFELILSSLFFAVSQTLLQLKLSPIILKMTSKVFNGDPENIVMSQPLEFQLGLFQRMQPNLASRGNDHMLNTSSHLPVA